MDVFHEDCWFIIFGLSFFYMKLKDRATLSSLKTLIKKKKKVKNTYVFAFLRAVAENKYFTWKQPYLSKNYTELPKEKLKASCLEGEELSLISYKCVLFLNPPRVSYILSIL